MLDDHVIWLLRLAVAAVFGVAAIGKFADPAGTRRTVREFGVPVPLVPAVASGLPGAEAVAALAVLPSRTAVAGGTLAFALLVVVSAAVAVALARGGRPDCACFGAGSGPVGAHTLVRNAALGVLVALATAASWAVPDVPGALPPDHAVGMAVVVALVIAQILTGARLRALRARLERLSAAQPRRGGPEVGAAAPDFTLPDLDGSPTSLAALIATGRPVVLLFVDQACGACQILAGEFEQWKGRGADRVTLVPIASGDPDTNRAWARGYDLDGLLVQRRSEVADLYRLRGTPSAVLVDVHGRVAAPSARGVLEVRDLLAESVLAPAG